MKKNRCIKLIAWLMALIMVISMMPISVLADTNITDKESNDFTNVSSQTGDPNASDGNEGEGEGKDENLSQSSGGGANKGSASPVNSEYRKVEDDTRIVITPETDPDPNKGYYLHIEYNPGDGANTDFDVLLEECRKVWPSGKGKAVRDG